MPPHILWQPVFIGHQDAQRKLIVGQIHGMETPVDHRDGLEGHLRQSPRHVQIGQHAVYVAGFQDGDIPVVLGAIVGVVDIR